MAISKNKITPILSIIIGIYFLSSLVACNITTNLPPQENIPTSQNTPLPQSWITQASPEELNALIQACAYGGYPGLGEMFRGLQAGNETKTLLQYAVEANDSHLLTFLLQWEENVNRINEPINARQQTLLHVAATRGSLATLEVLLKHSAIGFSIDQADLDGQIPLHLAAANGNLAVFQALLKYSPSTLIKPDTYGQTPLHLAVANGHIQICQAVHADNLFPYLEDGNGHTLLHLAIISSHMHIFTAVKKAFYPFYPYPFYPTDILRADHHGNTLLHLAIISNNTAIIADLLQHDAIRCTMHNTQNKNGKTPYQLAVDSGNTTMTQMIQDHIDFYSSSF